MSAIRQADGVAASKVRYSTSEEQRLLRDGARKFLRFGGPQLQELMLMGDCGAFAYVDHPEPAYTPAEVVEFYTGGRLHAWRVARPRHLRVRRLATRRRTAMLPSESRERYRDHAGERRGVPANWRERGRAPFEPLGAVQGWSPESMAEAAKRLEQMGYRYLAIGGLVPLKVDAIKQVLADHPRRRSDPTDIHLLGFAKAEHIERVHSASASPASTPPRR